MFRTLVRIATAFDVDIGLAELHDAMNEERRA